LGAGAQGLSRIASAPGSSSAAKAAVAAAALAVVTGGWLVASARLPAYVLPPPGEVAWAVVDFFSSPRKLGHLAATLRNIGVAISLSFTLGCALAFLAHYLRWSEPTIHRRLSPFLNSFPGVGWTLLAVIWFGVSMTTVVFAVSVVLLPFALINLREGLNALDHELGEMARSFTRTQRRVIVAVAVPAVIPFAFATLRIMFGVAWKVTLTAELFGGNQGLGYMVNLARQDFDTATIFVVILFVILSVYSADRLLLAPAERALARRYGTAMS